MLHKYKPLIFDAKSKKKLLYQGTYFYKWFNYGIPALCSIALLVGISMVIFPVVDSGNSDLVYAEENYEVDTQALSPNTVSLTMTNSPDSSNDSSTEVTAGEIAYREYGFNAKAGSKRGYKIYVQAASGYSNQLTGLANPKESINGVGSNVVTPSFTNNTWGYSLTDNVTTSNTDLTYNTIPEYGSTITNGYYNSNVATSDSGQDFKLAFAAKIGTDKPADHYQTKVLLSVIANPVYTLSNISNMQDITPNICEDTEEHYTKQLKDVRDGKYYWVAKLKDGNCWMTQNLDYDIEEALTDKLRYRDLGMYVKTNPLTQEFCGGTGVTSLSDESCQSAGWVSVDGYKASDKTDLGFIVNVTSKIYDAHYLIGNYYTWMAATNGSGENLFTTGAIATDSICPDGWELPLSGDSNNIKSKSFYYLLNQYNLTETLNNGTYNISGQPLYFLKSGYSDSLMRSVGKQGVYRSSVAYYSPTYTYSLSITDTVITSALNQSTRGNYLSIRCVAANS